MKKKTYSQQLVELLNLNGFVHQHWGDYMKKINGVSVSYRFFFAGWVEKIITFKKDGWHICKRKTVRTSTAVKDPDLLEKKVYEDFQDRIKDRRI